MQTLIGTRLPCNFLGMTVVDMGAYAALDEHWARGTARRVRAMLAYHEKNQTAAAAVLGLSQAAVSRRLRGDVAFSISELGRLAGWLDISVADLIPPSQPRPVYDPPGTPDVTRQYLRVAA